MMNNPLNEINQELEKNIDLKYRETNKRFFKEKYRDRGVRTSIVRKIARQFFKKFGNKNKPAILALCEELLKNKYNEDVTIAIQWLSYLNLEETDFKILERWLDNYIDNWGKDDDFCLNVLSHFIVKFPKCKEKVKAWSKSNNKWKRRASAVAFIQGGSWRIHSKYLNDIFDIALALMNDQEDLVQKGCGWMLKIASQTYPKEVLKFVIQHKGKMSRTTLRYSIEKMPEHLKKKAMSID